MRPCLSIVRHVGKGISCENHARPPNDTTTAAHERGEGGEMKRAYSIVSALTGTVGGLAILDKQYDQSTAFLLIALLCAVYEINERVKGDK